MLHATIESDRERFHFSCEVTGYDLETLQHHVQQTARQGSAVRLRLEIEPTDRKAFARFGQEWLPRVANRGTVEVQVVQLH